jgi:hypothetical protein
MANIKNQLINRLDRWLVSSLKFDVDSMAQKFYEGEEQTLDALRKILSQIEFPTIFFGRISGADLVEVIKKNVIVQIYKYFNISVFRESSYLRRQFYVFSI